MPLTDDPGSWSPTIYAGATFDRTLTVTIGSAVVNLTGYDVRMMARVSTASTATPAMSLGTANGMTLGGTAGTIRILQAATATAALGSAFANEVTPLVYDLELQDGSGVVTRLLQGVVTIMPEVTR